MLLGFKRRFAPFVLDGSKTHTVRADGGRAWKVGARCDCYIDSRQKTMRLIGRWPCVKVQPITIKEQMLATDLKKSRSMNETPYVRFVVAIDGEVLDRDELDAFAWRDGFRPAAGVAIGAFALMAEFWLKEHGKAKSVQFSGQIIHWDFSRSAAGPKKVKNG